MPGQTPEQVNASRPLAELLGTARRALVLGIGGGGDVVGALAVARQIEAAGGEAELGGVAWERFAIDPHHPGPRPLSDLLGIERLGGGAAALCSAEGRTPEGIRLAEAGVAAHLGRPTVLIDINSGSRAVAAGVTAAADRLECDLVVLLDVGGDVLATGSERGLSSPLCDAVMLASAAYIPERIETIGCVFGTGCDGELTVAEVLGRIVVLARDGAWIGTSSPGSEVAVEIVELAGLVPTEASLQAARCALGEAGMTPIREGRRTVELGPVGALAFFFDPLKAIGGAAPLAELVAGAPSIEEARLLMEEAGVLTELDYERRRAAEATASAPLSRRVRDRRALRARRHRLPPGTGSAISGRRWGKC